MKSLKKPSLLVNSFSNCGTLITSVSVGLFLTPYIISHVGKSGYGIWILIGSLIGYYGILDLGIKSAVSRYVAKYAGQKNDEALNEMINTAFGFFLCVGLFSIAASFLVAGPLSVFFKMPAQDMESFKRLVVLFGIATGLNFPANLFSVVIRAHERFVVANNISVFIILLRALLIFFFLKYGFGLVGIGYAYVIVSILMLVLNYHYCCVIFAHLYINSKLISMSMLKRLLGFGLITSILEVANIMRFHLDSFVIAKFMDVAHVAIYGIAAMLIKYFLEFVAKSTQLVFSPRFASLYGVGKIDELRMLFLDSLRVSSFLSFGIATILFLFGRNFIEIWVGKTYLDAYPILIVLLCSYSFALAQTPGISLVYAVKKHLFFAVISVGEAMINLGLSIFLVFHFGLFGVALGTAIPMLIVKILIQPLYISKVIEISWVEYVRQLFWPLLLSFIIIFVAKNFSFSINASGVLFPVVMCCIPIILLYVSTYFLFSKRVCSVA